MALPKRSPEEVRRFLDSRTDGPLHLTITRNRIRYLSFSSGDRGVWLRLNVEFLDAGDEVLGGVARWIAHPRIRCPAEVRQYIDACGPSPDRPMRRAVLRPSGRCHDLTELHQSVNKAHFGGAVSAPITWGRRTRRRKVSSRQLASYSRHRRVITVHPALDRREVPRRFLEYLVYHEMLHARQPEDKRRPHDRAFREALRRHPDHVWAAAWQKANLKLLGLA